MLKRFSYTVLMALACMLCACRTQRIHQQETSTLPGEIPAEMAPENDARFWLYERELVDKARVYLEQRRGRPVDARYQIRRLDGGWAVSVAFVTTYQNGHALASPGGRCTVIFDADGKVVRVDPN